MADQEVIEKIAKCGKVFCPAAPINQMQLFKGETDQLQSVISAITTRGKHVVRFQRCHGAFKDMFLPDS